MAASAAATTLALTPQHIKCFGIAKVFRDSPSRVASLDLSDDGELMVAACEDCSIRVFSIAQPALRKQVFAKKLGAALARFTHHDQAVLVASARSVGRTDEIRLLSLYDNQYLRAFKGHTDQVTHIAMHPTADTFLSASRDRTARVWDLRSGACTGVVSVPNPPVVAYDRDALVCAIADCTGVVNLFDVRDLPKGPFQSFRPALPPHAQVTQLQFSPDGRLLLVACNENHIEVLDSFDGTRRAALRSHLNAHRKALEASFSPDSAFVTSGSADGTIHTWEALTGTEVAVWKGHTTWAGCVAWHPRLALVASACEVVALWTPSLDAQGVPVPVRAASVFAVDAVDDEKDE